MTARRLLTLMLLVALIILVPAWYKARLTAEALDAAQLVAHTYEVEAGANTLAMNLRDREAVSLALANGIDTPLLRERMADSSAAIEQQFARLLELTGDEPRQQMLLGMLRATADQRHAPAAIARSASNSAAAC